MADYTAWAKTLVVIVALGAPSLGCNRAQEKEALAPPDVRLSTAEEESATSGESTYGAVRPRLSEVVTLGEIYLPNSGGVVAVAPAPLGQGPVIVNIENNVTQSTASPAWYPHRSRLSPTSRAQLAEKRRKAASSPATSTTSVPPPTTTSTTASPPRDDGQPRRVETSRAPTPVSFGLR